jgi:long-chain-fatty-acid--CoA ligase ACSBG
MNGYIKNEQATMEVIDNQGFFHTGDTGRVDEQGFVYITGRIKELIITAGGENIGPVIIEDIVKTFSNAISNIMILGEG